MADGFYNESSGIPPARYTIFNMVFVFGAFLSVLAGADLNDRHNLLGEGILPNFCSAILGFICFVILFVTALAALFYAIADPKMPRCQTGACDFRDYETVVESEGRCIQQCNCSDRYLMRDDRFGGRTRVCVYLIEDDRCTLYMIRDGFQRRWMQPTFLES